VDHDEAIIVSCTIVIALNAVVVPRGSMSPHHSHRIHVAIGSLLEGTT
jgi:hypothetical protein